MKFIVIPDSFKGSISAVDAAKTIKEALEYINPEFEIHSIPIADGGEGTVDCFLNITSGEKLYLNTVDLYNKPLDIYVCKYADTYILEMACSAGITLSKDKNPLIASTYGVGIIINEILKLNPQKIIIGLGGSGTNDCGVGMAVALGTKFYDQYNNEFTPTPLTFNKITRIDNSITLNKLKGIEIIGMCDVNNPLYGKLGATYIFGPQKGLKDNEIEIVDNNIKHLSNIIYNDLSINVSNIPGSGAAGGMGASILAFLNGKLQSGINTILDLIDFNNLINNANYVITGEGKFDSQSLNGKVISGIVSYCNKKNVPVIVVCGKIADINDSVYGLGIKEIHSINPENESYEKSIKNAKKNLYNTIIKIFK